MAEAQASANGPTGIGGWLMFLGIALGLGLLSALGQVAKETDDVAKAWASPVARPFLVALMIAFALITALHVATLYALFDQRRYFRDIFLWFWLASLLLTPLAIMVGVETTGMGIIEVWTEEGLGRYIGSSVVLSLWAMYVFRSVRVRNTMTR